MLVFGRRLLRRQRHDDMAEQDSDEDPCRQLGGELHAVGGHGDTHMITMATTAIRQRPIT